MGMCIDDESLFGCPEKLLQNWPHTEEPVQYVRLFKAFRPEDSEEVTTRTRESFVQYVKAWLNGDMRGFLLEEHAVLKLQELSGVGPGSSQLRACRSTRDGVLLHDAGFVELR